MEDYLYHHGILGQRWGVRRYQNPDGTLTAAGRRRLERQDMRWARKNEKKITRAVENAVKPYMKDFTEKELNISYRKLKTNGKVSRKYANAYNKRLVTLMNQAVGELEAPSGRVVQFVAKRGEIGAYMALADKGYDINQLRNGVYGDGRIAYRSNGVNMQTYE